MSMLVKFNYSSIECLRNTTNLLNIAAIEE